MTLSSGRSFSADRSGAENESPLSLLKNVNKMNKKYSYKCTLQKFFNSL